MPPAKKSISLKDIQSNWQLLDGLEFRGAEGFTLLSHEEFSFSGDNPIRYVPPNGFVKLFSAVKQLFYLFYALQLLLASSKTSVLIVNGGNPVWFFVGLLNRIIFFNSKNVYCWDIFVESRKQWKKAILASAMKGVGLSILWSSKQIATHAQFLDIPEQNFLFLPFKANHTKGPEYDIPIGNFVFSCGNGKRDYQTLTQAIRGTGIPLMICATDPNVRRQIEPLPNSIIIAATEPDFAKLQAACRIVVIPMQHTGLKGGGEANFCNGMWHGKPVIAADSISAEDYILDGKTGFVVPSGDVDALRDRIIKLWSNPELTTAMGIAGRKHVENQFTHAQFLQRLYKSAILFGQERTRRKAPPHATD